MPTLRQRCRALFHGRDRAAERARYFILCADIVILTYFVVATFYPSYGWILALDVVIGLWLAAELAGRALADNDILGFLVRPLTIIDVVVIASLFAAAIIESAAGGSSFVFLRVIRALRIARSYQVTYRLRHYSRFFARNEDAIFSAVNLFVFIFVVTAVVFVLQHGEESGIRNYVDALYFTITALTTTGFGDITLQGSTGRLLAVVIMIVGVALFIRLVQTIFRPNKIRFECPTCGLTRHEIDAVHCKHCGHEIHIRTEGVN